MDSIVSCVEFFEAKVGRVKELESALVDIAVLSRKEDGCIQYDVIRDIENEHLFILILIYKNKEAMKSHESQPYVISFSENQMNDLCSSVKWFDGIKVF